MLLEVRTESGGWLAADELMQHQTQTALHFCFIIANKTLTGHFIQELGDLVFTSVDGFHDCTFISSITILACFKKQKNVFVLYGEFLFHHYRCQ